LGNAWGDNIIVTKVYNVQSIHVLSLQIEHIYIDLINGFSRSSYS